MAIIGEVIFGVLDCIFNAPIPMQVVLGLTAGLATGFYAMQPRW